MPRANVPEPSVHPTGDGTATGIMLGEYAKAIGNTLDSVVGFTSHGISCEPTFQRSYARDNVLTRTGTGFPFACVNGGGNTDY